MEQWSTYTHVYAHELNLTRMWTAKAVAYKCASSLLAVDGPQAHSTFLGCYVSNVTS